VLKHLFLAATSAFDSTKRLAKQTNAVEYSDYRKAKESTRSMKMLKINEGQLGGGGNYNAPRLLTASASAITWQSTETLSSICADFKMSRLRATRAAAAAYTQG
jgi:hypothetical protein